MKRHFYTLGLMLAATFTLTNCAQEIDNPNDVPSAGIPFEIVATSAETKTVNDGLNTKWVAGDQINIFHAVAETNTYVSDGVFTIAEADVATGRFTGTLSATLESDKVYDWYALYPYSEYVTTPGEHDKGYTYIGHSKGLNQSGYDSMASLKESVCPLYGIATAVPEGTKPSMTMNHISSIVAINVTNATEEALTVTTASLTAEEDIVGSYFIDITKSPVVCTPSGANYVNNTATVNVSGGTELAKGESAILYLAIKPFTAATREKLVISVNGYSKELTMTKDVTFTAGKIKTLNFSYDKEEAPAPEGTSVVTIDLSAQGYENSQAVSTVSKLPVSIEFNQGSSSNAPAYYTSGTAVRVYSGGSFKVSTIAGKITNIKLTYGSSDGSNDITVDSGTFNKDTWSGEANSVKFTIGGTSGNRRIKAIEVTVVGGVPAEPTKLDAPIVECSGQTSNSLTFEWNAVTNAVGYEVSFNGGEAETITETTYVAEGLEAETLYEISVKAIGDGIFSITSEEQSCSGTTIKQGAAQEYTYIWTASSGDLGTTTNGTITKKLNDVDWEIQRSDNSGYTGWGNNAIQIGSKNSPENLTLKTSSISGIVKSVSVECASYSAKHNISISVGGVSYISKATPNWSNNTVGTVACEGNSTGDIEIKFTKGRGARALYIKSIKVVYEN